MVYKIRSGAGGVEGREARRPFWRHGCRSGWWGRDGREGRRKPRLGSGLVEGQCSLKEGRGEGMVLRVLRDRMGLSWEGGEFCCGMMRPGWQAGLGAQAMAASGPSFVG